MILEPNGKRIFVGLLTDLLTELEPADVNLGEIGRIMTRMEQMEPIYQEFVNQFDHTWEVENAG